MKKIILGLSMLVFAGAQVQTASAGVRVDFQPGYYSSSYYAPHQPVYCAPPQVIYAPPPRAVFYPPRVYIPPAPFFSFSFGGGGHYPRHGHHGGYNGHGPHHRVCR